MFKFRNNFWIGVAALGITTASVAQLLAQTPQPQPGIAGTWVAQSRNPTLGWTVNKRVTLRPDGTCTMASQGHGTYPSAWHSAVSTVIGTYTYNQGILTTTSQDGQTVLNRITWQSPDQLVCQNAEQTTCFVRAGSQATIPTSYFNVPNGTVSQVLASDANVSNNALAASNQIAANQNAISNGIMSSYQYRSATTSACVNRWCNEAIMGNQIYQGTNGQLYNLPNTHNQYHLDRWGQAVPGYDPYANVHMNPYQGSYNPYYGQ